MRELYFRIVFSFYCFLSRKQEQLDAYVTSLLEEDEYMQYMMKMIKRKNK